MRAHAVSHAQRQDAGAALKCSKFAAQTCRPYSLQLATFLSCDNVYLDCFEAVQSSLLLDVRPCALVGAQLVKERQRCCQYTGLHSANEAARYVNDQNSGMTHAVMLSCFARTGLASSL